MLVCLNMHVFIWCLVHNERNKITLHKKVCPLTTPSINLCVSYETMHLIREWKKCLILPIKFLREIVGKILHHIVYKYIYTISYKLQKHEISLKVQHVFKRRSLFIAFGALISCIMILGVIRIYNLSFKVLVELDQSMNTNQPYNVIYCDGWLSAYRLSRVWKYITCRDHARLQVQTYTTQCNLHINLWFKYHLVWSV